MLRFLIILINDTNFLDLICPTKKVSLKLKIIKDEMKFKFFL